MYVNVLRTARRRSRTVVYVARRSRALTEGPGAANKLYSGVSASQLRGIVVGVVESDRRLAVPAGAALGNCQGRSIRTVLQLSPVLVDLTDVNDQSGHACQHSSAQHDRHDDRYSAALLACVAAKKSRERANQADD